MDVIDCSKVNVYLKNVKKEISLSPSSSSSHSLSLSPSTSDNSSTNYSSNVKIYSDVIIFNKFNPPSICFVCGTSANCHHYGIPSCSGCKTFFRRTILTTPNYICKTNKLCKELKRCRSCRFDQCLRVGMNPNGVLIPSGTNNYDKIQAFIRRHESRYLLKEKTCNALQTIPKQFTVLSLERSKNLQYLIYLESKMFVMRISGDYNPMELFSYSVKDLMKKDVEIAKADKYSMISKHSGEFKLYLLIDIILCIDSARLLPGIQGLDDSDLEIILKHSGLILALFTQVFYSYQNHCDTLTLPDGSVPMKCMKQKSRLELECFCRCIEPVERSQITLEEYVLAKAIALFNPAIPELSSQAQAILAVQREKYANILFKHEQESYGIGPGAVKYSKIMAAIEAMYHFTQRQREFHNICHMQFITGQATPWPKTVALRLFEDSVI